MRGGQSIHVAGRVHWYAEGCQWRSRLGRSRPVLLSGRGTYRAVVRVQLDGDQIRSEADFHRHLAALLDFGPYYGRNLDALWDRLITDVPRPVHLTWTASRVSRSAMGRTTFDRIERILRAVAAQDAAQCWTDRFTYDLA